jgi:hypothetical protein
MQGFDERRTEIIEEEHGWPSSTGQSRAGHRRGRRTYEVYVGRAGLERSGKKKWQRHVADVLERLVAALQPEETVIGGGNVKKLDVLPSRCRAGENANAFRGGFARG